MLIKFFCGCKSTAFFAHMQIYFPFALPLRNLCATFRLPLGYFFAYNADIFKKYLHNQKKCCTFAAEMQLVNQFIP